MYDELAAKTGWEGLRAGALIAAAALACGASCRTEPAPPPPPPDGRHSAPSCFDTRRARTLLFGGAWEEKLGRRRLAAFGDDLWTRDAAGWRPLQASPRPPARAAHGLAYDEARDRLVLFGGRDALQRFGDTWEWDGERWHHAASAGPAPRYGHQMRYDAATRRVVLIGGTDYRQRFDDAWSWDGRAWQAVAGAHLLAMRKGDRRESVRHR